MHRLLQRIGTIVFFCSWPAFWLYYKRSQGRTRVVIRHQGKVLVVKQWISPGKWNLPGGGRHKGESILDSVVREVREETGLRLNPRQLKHVGTDTYNHYGLSFNYNVFAAKLLDSHTIRPQRIEISALMWLDPALLDTKNAGPDTLRSLQIAHQGVLLQ